MKNMPNTQPTMGQSPLPPVIAVTGASGQLGRLVVEALAARDVAPERVILGSRNPANIAAHGFRTARADFADPASLLPLFDGADMVLLISSNEAEVAERQAQHRAAIDAARLAGVGRVVFTSFTNPVAESLFPYGAGNGPTEAYLVASGLAYTIARNNQYFENLAGSLAHAVETGTLAMPGADGKVAYVSRVDLAEALTALLLEEGHANKTYELTGPTAIDLHQIGQLLGVNVVDLPGEQFAPVLASFGLPPVVVDALIGMYAASAAGEYAKVSRDIETLLGRPATPFASYAREFRATVPG
jgi:NAD(P)H dehydrogenase (quinone)